LRNDKCFYRLLYFIERKESNMKKFLAVLLILVMVFTFAACGSSGGSGGGDEGSGAVTVEDEVKQAEIRQAIGLLFDRNYICEEIGQAGQLPAGSFVAMGMTEPDGSQFYENANGGGGYYSVDPADFEANVNEAIEILKKYYEWDESAQKFTNFPTLTYLYNTSEGHKAIGEYLQSALASVGITINL
jgi:oligopeptide transport system substrate-binding protein